MYIKYASRYSAYLGLRVRVNVCVGQGASLYSLCVGWELSSATLRRKP